MNARRPREPWLVALATFLGCAGLTVLAVFAFFAVGLSQLGSNK